MTMREELQQISQESALEKIMEQIYGTAREGKPSIFYSIPNYNFRKSIFEFLTSDERPDNSLDFSEMSDPTKKFERDNSGILIEWW